MPGLKEARWALAIVIGGCAQAVAAPPRAAERSVPRPTEVWALHGVPAPDEPEPVAAAPVPPPPVDWALDDVDAALARPAPPPGREPVVRPRAPAPRRAARRCDPRDVFCSEHPQPVPSETGEVPRPPCIFPCNR